MGDLDENPDGHTGDSATRLVERMAQSLSICYSARRRTWVLP